MRRRKTSSEVRCWRAYVIKMYINGGPHDLPDTIQCNTYFNSCEGLPSNLMVSSQRYFQDVWTITSHRHSEDIYQTSAGMFRRHHRPDVVAMSCQIGRVGKSHSRMTDMMRVKRCSYTRGLHIVWARYSHNLALEMRMLKATAFGFIWMRVEST
jgi:hypothetical protein